MKKLLILVLSIACGCSCLLGEVTTKGQDEIPPTLLEKGPIAIGEIRRYWFSPETLLLHFIMDGAHEGKKISFLVNFSRLAKVESRATLRVGKGKNFTDYRLDLGSKFAKGLAKRISLKMPKESDAPPPYLTEADYKLKNLGPARIKAFRQLLKGKYSRENEPK